jgi:hypothetical protein
MQWSRGVRAHLLSSFSRMLRACEMQMAHSGRVGIIVFVHALLLYEHSVRW